MFTEIKIALSENLTKRGFIYFYIDGKRYREYCGKKFDLNLNPNSFKSYNERLSSLRQLAFEVTKAIENGWLPNQVAKKEQEPTKKSITFSSALSDVLQEKLNSNLSRLYKRDLKNIYNRLLGYYPLETIDKNIFEIEELEIEGFLDQFKSSGTYYMSKRKTTNVFFSELVRKKLLKENPLNVTRSMKKVPKLHKTYNSEQLNSVLNYLGINYPKLHICCLLTYGCFLRPHQEIRLLKKRHFTENIDKIILSSSENKSRRVRTSVIPLYVRNVIQPLLELMENPEQNLLSNSNLIYNESYINTQWSRAKAKMLALGILEKGHTIYSFRHTAAVNVYQKTKDLHILQQLLQHSNMIVTLNYLRGLGEINDERLKEVMPEL